MKTKALEVRNVISSAETLRLTLPSAFSLHIEVRQKQNGAWRVWYPDEAWIPCEPRCLIKHKHDHEQNWIESRYEPTDLEDALVWADSISEGREVKVLEYVPVAQRRRNNQS